MRDDSYRPELRHLCAARTAEVVKLSAVAMTTGPITVCPSRPRSKYRRLAGAGWPGLQANAVPQCVTIKRRRPPRRQRRQVCRRIALGSSYRFLPLNAAMRRAVYCNFILNIISSKRHAQHGCARAASKQSRGSLLRRPAKRVVHSWRVHRASEPAPPCPRSGRLTTAGAADRKTPSNRSRGAAARPPNIGRTHSEHTNQYWPIWPILANTLFPRRGGVKHITKGPNLCAQVPCIPPMDALAGQVLCIQ